MTASDIVEPTVLGEAENKQRNAVIQGLRELADFLALHPDVPCDSYGVSMQVYGLNKDDLVRAVRAGGVEWRKLHFGSYFELRATFSGEVSIGLNTDREQVCEKRVVGQETVEVPDPDAPKVTVTRDVIEWDCTPLLG